MPLRADDAMAGMGTGSLDTQGATREANESGPVAGAIRRGIEKVQIREKANPRWSTHYNNKLLTVPQKGLFSDEDCFFTIGSCFAERIRIAMADQGLRVGPPMEEIPIDRDRYRIDGLPQRPHMAYYNTYTVRQEFERHVGEWRQADNDYWVINKDPYWGGEQIFQDPYRRMVIGRTLEDLRMAVRLCDEAVDRGIRNADIFAITYGMVEVFINKQSGKVACQKPGYAGGSGEFETEFYMSGFAENYENVKRTVEIISQVRANARIVLTVSPVSLARTFGDQDILSANTEGKSILRAVLGQIARDYEQVTYFPSYEMVMYNAPHSFREDDGRHIQNWAVDEIVQAFTKSHSVKT